MSETSDDPIPYRVTYSEFVQNEMKKLIARAKERGLDSQVLAAVKEMDRRLHVYPQFGDPLRDLSLESAKLCMANVPPLVVHYILHEEQRLVMIVAPILTLPHSGL